MRRSLWRAAMVGLAVTVLGACAHGGDDVHLSAGTGAEASTSTTVAADPTTSSSESSTTSATAPATTTSGPHRATTTTGRPSTTTAPPPANCTPPASTTTTSAGGNSGGGSYDTTSVTGLAPSGGFRTGPAPGPPCPLPVAAGSWRTFDPGPLASRSEAVGVWTGHEMVIVGGLVGYAAGSDGAAYNPQTGHWRMIATRPDPDHVVRLGAWTGQELVVLGVPRDNLSGPPTTTAAYDPATDHWRTAAPPPAELSSGQLTPFVAGWTGSRVALYEVGWGQAGRANFARAGLYDPATDRWTVLPAIDDATAVGRAVVAGDRLAVLALTKGPAGPEPRLFLSDTDGGGWHASPPAPVAIPSYPQVAPFWTGREVVVTPTRDYPDIPSVAYDPATDRWRTLDAPNILDVSFGQPSPRLGDGRVVAEVDNPSGPLALYDPERDSWTGTGSLAGVPARDGVVVSTGDEVLVWAQVSEGGYVHPERPPAAWVWTTKT